MPVRRADSLTTLRVQCRAPNSLADSRHQACLVSNRRTLRYHANCSLALGLVKTAYTSADSVFSVIALVT